MIPMHQVNGKRVTAFTDGEEDAVGYRAVLPVHEGLGATCNEVSVIDNYWNPVLISRGWSLAA
jgi:hypothetical protein